MSGSSTSAVSAPDQLHKDLDALVQEVTGLKTGRTNRVPIVARPMASGWKWEDILHLEAQACVNELKAKNTRTAARTARSYRTIRKSMR
jgi:hypothetical protein